MFDLSPIQLIIVLVIAVLVLGPTKLPEFSRAVGKGIRDFKDTISGDAHHDDEPPPVTTATAGPPEQPTASPDVLEGIVMSGDAPPVQPRRADGPPPAG